MIARTLEIQQSLSERLGHYLGLCKLKVVSLIVFTAIVGMALSQPGWLALDTMLFATLGIGMAASSAAAINHLLDAKADELMARTRNRPLPRGQLSEKDVVVFALSLGAAAMAILVFLVNPLTAGLTFLSLMGYAVVYTAFLKRTTPQNIVIGGAAGAAPPVLGWTAMTGELHAHALVLFLIIFVWTPPHFWALAIARKDEYAKADVPMLPVTHGTEFTKTCILIYTILLTVVCFLPYLVGMSGTIYLVGVSLLNAIFLGYAWKLKYAPKKRTAFNMFAFSIWHLMLLFVILLVDHYV